MVEGARLESVLGSKALRGFESLTLCCFVIDFLKMKIGEIQLVTCHRMPDRSFFFKGRQFPLCARCTGIYIGYLSLPFFTIDLIHLSLLLSIVLIIPTIIDGLTQAYCKRESNNMLRLITGILSGVGQMSICSIIGKSLGHFIINNIL